MQFQVSKWPVRLINCIFSAFMKLKQVEPLFLFLNILTIRQYFAVAVFCCFIPVSPNVK